MTTGVQVYQNAKPYTMYTPTSNEYNPGELVPQTLIKLTISRREKRLGCQNSIEKTHYFRRHFHCSILSSQYYQHKLVGLVKKFHPMAGELTVDGGLLMRGNRLVIPSALQAEVLTQLHVGHQGIQKCRERAKQSVQD